ncbi:Fpg/Nei family DNA glycosylase [Rubellicoccus peritrichatus]|uniref:DNA-formamidopyrimidine glycosylase family protein n=1 Tax=Rubellicoccus peritrichatus TaxID=3080537 RepID=A0AAQ3QVF7_9BACT|nr:DNA-formamidopyrimidine glycosylase family protein [Puniceicoccus sp. CR14]WOO40772.1 DNA-formamidopyrimidine glycosylase family protein [Puniceicoccus sp. CR14]
MPELAEVEYYRKQWDPALGKKIIRVCLHADKRVFRGSDTNAIEKELTGAIFRKSYAHGKQMLFEFSGGRWLGVHLGMTGELYTEQLPYAPDKHEHLVLETKKVAIVFKDPRLFGRIRFDAEKGFPDWWRALPPDVLSDDFSQDSLNNFLKRRSKSSIKAVLLMQERFPGIGNWMADEMLWRAGIHPATPAGSISSQKVTQLFNEIKAVCSDAMEVIGTDWSDPPDTWLFNHRWKDGGVCPKTNVPLMRDQIGGRTTCWSPARQRL